MILEEFIEKLSLILGEPGVITRIELTYDVCNKYSARIIGNDSNPETGYYLYADVTRKNKKLSEALADAFEAYAEERG